MKKFAACLFAAVGLATTVAQAQQSNPDIVISQVWGAGGGANSTTNGNPTHKCDYVELHNRSGASVDVTGYTIRYASATGTAWASSITLDATKLVSGRSYVIPAGGYFLVRLACGSTSNAAAQLAVDGDAAVDPANPVATTGINMSATGGKIGLFSNNTAPAGAVCSNLSGGAANLIDFIGYGGTVTVPSCGEGTIATNAGNAVALFRASDGCLDTNNNATDFAQAAPAPRNSLTAPVVCGASFPDCNGNAQDDRIEINATGGTNGIGGTLDCNTNGVIDTCEIGANSDRNNNSILDFCEINAAGGTNGIGGTLDCNSNGILDSADITTNPRLDEINNNGVLDSCDVPGPGQDCNGNGKLDAWDLKIGVLTDVDANGTPDSCEGAIVKEVDENATVQAAGVRAATFGTDFFNVQEAVTPNANESYGGLRWDIPSLALPSGFTPTRVYLWLQQDNAAFSSSSLFAEDSTDINYTANDSISFVAGTATTDYDNLATDYTDLALAANYSFIRGTGPNLFPSTSPGGSGTIDSYKLFDNSGSNLSGGDAIAAKLTGNTGKLTLIIKGADVNTGVFAATYAGRTSNRYSGPQIVIFGTTSGPTCNDLDFNNDGQIEPGDVDAYFSILGEGACLGDIGGGCDSLDFNNDGNIEPEDVDAYFSVLGEGPCINN